MRKVNNLLLSFFAALSLVAFVSCSSDDEEESTTSVKIVEITHSVNLSDDFYKFFDIEVQFTSSSNNVTTKMATKNDVVKLEFSPSSAPKEVLLNVTARPKNPMPDIDNSAKYTFEKNINLVVVGYTSSKKDAYLFHYSSPVKNSQSFTGEKARQYVAKEHALYKHSYTVPQQ